MHNCSKIFTYQTSFGYIFNDIKQTDFAISLSLPRSKCKITQGNEVDQAG